MVVLTEKQILFGECLNSGIPHSIDLWAGQDLAPLNSEISVGYTAEPMLVAVAGEVVYIQHIKNCV
jgi:hypothetical protein